MLLAILLSNAQNPTVKNHEFMDFVKFIAGYGMAGSQVVAVTNPKDGVSKTSLAVNLAAEILALGKSVVVFDLDPQQSVSFWASSGEGVLSKITRPLDASDAKAFRKAIDAARAMYQRIILDCPPSFSEAALNAMQEADAVLLPVQPSSLDIKAGHDALTLARTARTMRKGKLEIGLVPNRMARTRLGADLLSALVMMGERVLPPIGNRSVVAESATNGLTVREAEPKSVSAKEFAALAIGVEGLLAA